MMAGDHSCPLRPVCVKQMHKCSMVKVGGKQKSEKE